ncbi:putative RNA pseudouridylate synthase [Lyophyllum shimeji]|uniref:RNA pseudouridylate synthase n=1 Tax=Lyophyllum shimeji TaxID=47721 RepID=A0A9P3Q0D7_LYOSH|nr:putative RNA pseudouridylate synthase [Lyophyllum shimeji]
MTSRFVQQTGRSMRALESVIYCDRAIIVLQKPPGLVCQLNHSRSLWVEGRMLEGNRESNFNALLHGLGKALGDRPFPVHRLDKGTTGALLLARSATHARKLSQQFQSRTVDKTYLALVRGGAKSFPSKSGEIRTPILYNDGRASIDPSFQGDPSATEWELIASSSKVPLSLLRLKLHTGHKHQLRVHLAHCLNVPILGDTLYSKKPPSEIIRSATTVPEDRIFLHAAHLSLFQYRASGPKKRFRLGISAPLPADFVKICIDSEIPLAPAEVHGGVFIDGELVEDGKVPDLGGSWMPELNGMQNRT